jgi:hypothetical protein
MSLFVFCCSVLAACSQKGEGILKSKRSKKKGRGVSPMRTMQQMRPKAAPLCYVERSSSISRERESGEAGMCCRPSLLCQLAAIVYRNPFQDCLNRQLQRWLTQDLSDNSKETNGNNEIHHTAARHPTHRLGPYATSKSNLSRQLSGNALQSHTRTNKNCL